MDDFGDTTASANSEGSETEVPQNPELPVSELTRSGLRLLNEGTLAYLTYGPGSVRDCYRALSNVAPVFRSTQAAESGIGLIGGRTNAPWLGFEGNEGSVIAYFVSAKGDPKWDVDNILMRLTNLPGPWHSDICTAGSLPASAAHILQSARAVPVWEIVDFEHTDSDLPT